MKQWINASIISLFSILLTACGDSPPPKNTKPIKQTVSTHSKGLAILQQKRLSYAVIMVRANVGNLQNSGGYQMWSANKMVDALIRLSKTSGAHVPGEPRVKKQSPEISYVKGKVTKPWQIVLIPNDRAKKIVVKAYGGDISKPAIVREVPVSTY